MKKKSAIERVRGATTQNASRSVHVSTVVDTTCSILYSCLLTGQLGVKRKTYMKESLCSVVEGDRKVNNRREEKSRDRYLRILSTTWGDGATRRRECWEVESHTVHTLNIVLRLWVKCSTKHGTFFREGWIIIEKIIGVSNVPVHVSTCTSTLFPWVSVTRFCVQLLLIMDIETIGSRLRDNVGLCFSSLQDNPAVDDPLLSISRGA